jgi:hypothetical protein
LSGALRSSLQFAWRNDPVVCCLSRVSTYQCPHSGDAAFKANSDSDSDSGGPMASDRCTRSGPAPVDPGPTVPWPSYSAATLAAPPRPFAIVSDLSHPRRFSGLSESRARFCPHIFLGSRPIRHGFRRNPGTDLRHSKPLKSLSPVSFEILSPFQACPATCPPSADEECIGPIPFVEYCDYLLGWRLARRPLLPRVHHSCKLRHRRLPGSTSHTFCSVCRRKLGAGTQVTVEGGQRGKWGVGPL